MSPSALLALWVAKALARLARLRGTGGSTFPGRVALRIEPRLLAYLSAQHMRGNITISGTNGKTTTAKMIADIFVAAGWRPAHNRTGANLIYGIASEFAQRANLFGRMQTDVGLAEVDEATMPLAVKELAPGVALVTNFFRDQLDRFGELETTVSLVRKGLEQMASGSTVVLNADDPLAASLGESSRLRNVFYGIEDRSMGMEGRAQVADIKRCPHCGAEYEYSGVFYAHLGRYRCPSCGYKRPEPQVKLLTYRSEGARGSFCSVSTPEGTIDFSLKLPGVYNAYNALGAVACASTLGVPLDTIRDALSRFTSSFGRMELVPVGTKQAFIALVKNPTGFNEVIRTLLEGEEEKNIVIAINDRYADGTDVSWLWDVDFERLASRQQKIRFVITSGIRAEDMAVRLKYAGLSLGLLSIEKDVKKALDRALGYTPDGGLLYILPTYTAMLEVRDALHRMGHARQFWEV